MSIGDTAANADPTSQDEKITQPSPKRRRHAGHRSPWLGLGIALVVAIAAFAAYHVYTAPATVSSCASHPHSLTIWTYESMFGSGNFPNQTRDAVFSTFENRTGSTVTVDYLTGDLATALLDSKPCQLPDLVMGLDELEAPRVDAAGLLVPYSPLGLSNVPAWAVADLAPDHSVTPYEYGFLGLDYNLSFDSGCGQCLSQGDFLQAMEQRSALASGLCYPDPLQQDITGEEFLAMEVEFSTQVLHQNWTTFWRDVSPYDHPQPDWTTGWNEFVQGQCPTFVSYALDPATEEYFGAGGWMNSTTAHEGAENYSWLTDYGTGIVRGPSSNLSLDEAFIDWTLSGSVQSLIPENEWMYPANTTTPLPAEFSSAEPFSSITPLNSFTTPQASAVDLPGWIDQLQSIVLP
jgi:thiamine transport system substrate-binding protein